MKSKAQLEKDVAEIVKMTLERIEDPVEKWKAFHTAIKALSEDYDVSAGEKDTIFKEAVYQYVGKK